MRAVGPRLAVPVAEGAQARTETEGRTTRAIALWNEAAMIYTPPASPGAICGNCEQPAAAHFTIHHGFLDLDAVHLCPVAVFAATPGIGDNDAAACEETGGK